MPTCSYIAQEIIFQCINFTWKITTYKYQIKSTTSDLLGVTGRFHVPLHCSSRQNIRRASNKLKCCHDGYRNPVERIHQESHAPWIRTRFFLHDTEQPQQKHHPRDSPQKNVNTTPASPLVSYPFFFLVLRFLPLFPEASSGLWMLRWASPVAPPQPLRGRWS